MKTITIKLRAKHTEGPNKGQEWSPQTDAHILKLVGWALAPTKLDYEIVKIEEE